MDAAAKILFEVGILARRIGTVAEKELRQLVGGKVGTVGLDRVQEKHLQVQIVVGRRLLRHASVKADGELLLHALEGSADVAADALSQPAAVNLVKITVKLHKFNP